MVAMVAHVLSVHLMPKVVHIKISSLIIKIRWSSTLEKRPIYWRSIKLLESLKEDGGLGFKDEEQSLF